ncbi:Beta-galactosidase-1-like protein 2 [Merluccius polli]|uniref:Beta-galactosidase n=1 Tax=Merluccius polli TaxID=89951 RepID=A0AA47N062_MERPO|nr:Beta-galactosidase-1-like protein 2 [Merluccius polli]
MSTVFWASPRPYPLKRCPGSSTSRCQTEVRRMSSTEGLMAHSSQFTLEGKPFRILGGSVHYFRVPKAHWEDRLLKMKACGLNTLTTYVPWNLHEPERGMFNFQDQLDLKAYISLAAELGLWVILRPGPYICAEWDLGGLPSWLLQDTHMQLRTTYPGFVSAVNSYFDKLIPLIKHLMFQEGGPIIAVQVENEYGSYAKDDKYMAFIKNCLLSRGITELLLTSDNWEGLRCGGVEEDMLAVVSEILERGVSINLYMFHGGTSFGFMNGAMDLGTYKSQVSSYDYDAPLSEAGDYTPKYHYLRTLFSQNRCNVLDGFCNTSNHILFNPPEQYQPKVLSTEALPEVPPLQKRSAYPPVAIQQYLCLWDTLHLADKPLKTEKPVNMENLPVNNNNGQSYGYTLYETTITSGGTLNSMNNIRDRALVFVDRQPVGSLNYKTHELTLPDGKRERTLSLLVENCGRVNYGKALNDQRKGLVGDILLNNAPLRGFTIYCLDMKPSFMKRLSSVQWKSVPQKPSFPGFFQATLNLEEAARDTFLTLSDWGKGVVFINGQNLGRHWFIGPQHFLYLPGPWLRRGENQIIVFEEHKTEEKLVFAENPDHGKTIDVYKLPFCTLL